MFHHVAISLIRTGRHWARCNYLPLVPCRTARNVTTWKDIARDVPGKGWTHIWLKLHLNILSLRITLPWFISHCFFNRAVSLYDLAPSSLLKPLWAPGSAWSRAEMPRNPSCSRYSTPFSSRARKAPPFSSGSVSTVPFQKSLLRLYLPLPFLKYVIHHMLSGFHVHKTGSFLCFSWQKCLPGPDE